MRTVLVTIRDSASIIDAAKKMKERGVGSLLVLDSKEKTYGIITESDIVRKALASGKVDSGLKEFVSSPLVTISAGSDIYEAAKTMGAKNVKRLVIIADGKITGIISAKDIVRISPSLCDLIAETEHAKAEAVPLSVRSQD
ncbi:MAG: CBS domain-containing protein [Candidatus Micrarchaeia archaeon]